MHFPVYETHNGTFESQTTRIKHAYKMVSEIRVVIHKRLTFLCFCNIIIGLPLLWDLFSNSRSPVTFILRQNLFETGERFLAIKPKLDSWIINDGSLSSILGIEVSSRTS